MTDGTPRTPSLAEFQLFFQRTDGCDLWDYPSRERPQTLATDHNFRPLCALCPERCSSYSDTKGLRDHWHKWHPTDELLRVTPFVKRINKPNSEVGMDIEVSSGSKASSSGQRFQRQQQRQQSQQ
ncbi:hypothetical protein CF319_g5289 [Tilletia indica]|nr:hypothetical protein CF319_g5289 [Tilletia indica]